MLMNETIIGSDHWYLLQLILTYNITHSNNPTFYAISGTCRFLSLLFS